MCCCGKATINGEPGYRWNEPNGSTSVRPINAPTLRDDDVLIFDEPGRCGGLDCHEYHFRVVLAKHGTPTLLVRHGGGDEQIQLFRPILSGLEKMDTTARFWVLHQIYYAQKEAARIARDQESFKWRMAIAEKRVKTNRRRIRGMYPKVWIVDKGVQS